MDSSPSMRYCNVYLVTDCMSGMDLDTGEVLQNTITCTHICDNVSRINFQKAGRHIDDINTLMNNE